MSHVRVHMNNAKRRKVTFQGANACKDSIEYVLIASARLTGNNSNNPFDEQKTKQLKTKRKIRFANCERIVG